jgi:hypothetical protein
VQADVLLVFCNPAGDHYQTALTFRRGETVALVALPEIQFRVSDMLGS